MDFRNTEEMEDFINWLFFEIQSILPAFKQAWPTKGEYAAAKRNWTLAFCESNLKSMNQIKIGLKRLRSQISPFVPTCGQFIELCKATAQELGLPTVEKAYTEACAAAHPQGDKIFSHRVVEHAFVNVGSYNLKTYPKSVSYPMFEHAYEVSCQSFMNGDKLTEIPKAIEDKTEELITKQKGIAALSDIKKHLGMI
jgi:hypothetical protein